MNAIQNLSDPRLSTAKAAKRLGMSRSWLEKARASGRGPRFVRQGGRVFYRASDLDAWTARCVVETADTRGVA